MLGFFEGRRAREVRLRRSCLCILAAMSSPALATPAHRAAGMRAVAGGAGASSMFDHVPAAAERIAAGFGVVTSTFRTVAHNHAVGGVPDSFHLLGRAIDVARRPGVTHAQSRRRFDPPVTR